MIHNTSDRISWVDHERTRHKIYRAKENAYWSLCLSENADQPRKLWREISSIFGSAGKKGVEGSPSAHEFLNFFTEKVEAVRRETGISPPESFLESPAVSFSEFENYETETIEKVIRSASSKSCPLDPIPTNSLQSPALLLPTLVEHSLSRDQFLSRLKTHLFTLSYPP